MADFMGFEASGAEIPIYGECHGQKKGLRARRPDSLEFISLYYTPIWGGCGYSNPEPDSDIQLLNNRPLIDLFKDDDFWWGLNL